MFNNIRGIIIVMMIGMCVVGTSADNLKLFRQCGSELFRLLSTICNNNFAAPPVAKRAETESPEDYSTFQQTLMSDDTFRTGADTGLVYGHRLERSAIIPIIPKLGLDLVFQCCHRSCTYKHIREYCN